MTGPITVAPIGVVRGGRREIFEDHWGPVISQLILDSADSPSCVAAVTA